jgi:hypothetical protein
MGWSRPRIGIALLIACSIIAIQLVDIIDYGNKMMHLTNWAWVTHGILLLAAVCAQSHEGLLYAIVGVGSCVALGIATGMACIYMMDDSMVVSAEQDYGKAVVHIADVVFHWLPVVMWMTIRWLRRGYSWPFEVRRFMEHQPHTGAKVIFCFFAAIFSFFLFASYAIMFSPSEQYPGNINFGAMALAILAVICLDSVYYVCHVCVGRE